MVVARSSRFPYILVFEDLTNFSYSESKGLMLQELPNEILVHINTYVLVSEMIDDILQSCEEMVRVREDLRQTLCPSALVVYNRCPVSLQFSQRLLSIVRKTRKNL